MVYRAPDFKTVAIFGGTGFIGRYIVRDLAKRSWRVNVATRDATGRATCSRWETVGQICPVFANVRDEASTAAAVRGADYVINLVVSFTNPGRRSSNRSTRPAPDASPRRRPKPGRSG